MTGSQPPIGWRHAASVLWLPACLATPLTDLSGSSSVGDVAQAADYFTAVGVHLLPAKPVLLACAFLLTQLASLPSIAQADGAVATTSDARQEVAKS